MSHQASWDGDSWFRQQIQHLDWREGPTGVQHGFLLPLYRDVRRAFIWQKGNVLCTVPKLEGRYHIWWQAWCRPCHFVVQLILPVSLWGRHSHYLYFLVEVRDPGDEQVLKVTVPRFWTKSVWLQSFPSLCTYPWSNSRYELLNLDQLLAGMLQNTFVQGARDWARWTLDISPSGEILRVHVWNKQSEEDQSSLWLLEDFRSFRSGNRIQTGELRHHP